MVEAATDTTEVAADPRAEVPQEPVEENNHRLSPRDALAQARAALEVAEAEAESIRLSRHTKVSIRPRGASAACVAALSRCCRLTVVSSLLLCLSLWSLEWWGRWDTIVGEVGGGLNYGQERVRQLRV